MILDDHERAKFAAYLRECVASDELIIAQFDKMPGLGRDHVRHERIRCAAKRVVADWLEQVEGVTLRPAAPG